MLENVIINQNLKKENKQIKHHNIKTVDELSDQLYKLCKNIGMQCSWFAFMLLKHNLPLF